LETSEWLSIASLILGGGFIASMIAVYKARPERDSVVVTSAQNAAEILKGLNDALYTELKRTRDDRDQAQRCADAYEKALRDAKLPYQRSEATAATAPVSRRNKPISVKREPDSTTPREGDTLVTLTCDGTLPLERRLELLTYAFAKTIQGAVLRVILRWDIANGCLKFIVGEGAARPGPRGQVEINLADVDDESVTSVAEPYLPARS
jgi:hypothetical protein